jgi:hypothetical protein
LRLPLLLLLMLLIFSNGSAGSVNARSIISKAAL